MNAKISLSQKGFFHDLIHNVCVCVWGGACVHSWKKFGERVVLVPSPSDRKDRELEDR